MSMSATAHDAPERDGGQDALLAAYRLLLRIGQRHEGEPASAESSQRWGAMARQAAAQAEPPAVAEDAPDPLPRHKKGPAPRPEGADPAKSVSTATTRPTKSRRGPCSFVV